MSRLITNAIRSTSASTDAITMDGSGNVTFPANATCSGTATGFGGGKILQVVSTAKTDVFTTSSTYSSPVAITGLSVSITPSSSSNKILINVSLGHVASTGGNSSCYFWLYKGGSVISGAIGDTSNSNTRVTFYNRSAAQAHGTCASMTYLDNADSTSSLTYQLYGAHEGSSSSLAINRSGDSGTSGQYGRTISTITAMEIAA